MSDETSLHHLPVDKLAQRCAEETDLYFRHQSHDPQYCFELFRRAIRRADQYAWEVICVQYQSLVSGWVRQHHGFEPSGEEIQYFVNGAFGKISASLTPDKFEKFSDIKALLSYLKMCVHSVIVDYNRQADQGNLYSLDDILHNPATDLPVESQATDHEYRQELWDWLNARLHDEKERLVIYASFVLGLKPRELYEQSPKAFASVDEIYRTLQNVIARLRRDPGAQKFLGEND